MTAHISDQDIRGYLSRGLRSDELFAADEHLEKCGQCFARLAELRDAEGISPKGIVIEADPDHCEHLSYDQFAAYADGDLNGVDKEIADTHLTDCTDCSMQLDTFFSLRTELESETNLASLPADAADRETAGNWWGNLGWGKVGLPAFTAVLLAIAVWALLLRAPITQLETAANMNQPNGASDTDASQGDPNINAAGMIAGVGEDQNSNAAEGTTKPVVSLTDSGGTITLDGSGNLTGVGDSRFDERVKAALTRQAIDISPAVRDVQLKGGVLMGEDQPGVAFALTGPVGKVVDSTRPRFSWKPLKDADSYVVKIFDAKFRSVAESPPLRSTVWVPPVQLSHGNAYQWQVTAIKDGEEVVSPVRPAPDARFRVADAAAVNDIAAARRATSHLVLGITYANAGLIDEAETEFQALAKQNPNSTVVKKLLQKVRSAR